jgi:hypothetical protein
MSETKSDKRAGEVIPLALARVHPAYQGLTEGQLRAALRSEVYDLTLEELAALTWRIGRYAAPVTKVAP